MKTLHILRNRVAQITLASDLALPVYPEARQVYVADNTVVSVGQTYLLSPLTEDVVRHDGGHLGRVQRERLHRMNLELAAGRLVFSDVTTAQVDGIPYRLTGTGTSAQFVPLIADPNKFKPRFVTQPISQTVSLTAQVTLWVEALAATSLQWYKNGVLLGGATSAHLVIVSAGAGDADAVYTCVATNADGSVESDPAYLFIGGVSVTPPVVVTAPAAPVLLSAVPGNGQVTVVLSAPSNNGGAAILEYEANLSSGNSQLGTGTTLVVPATNGVAVTARVRARNSQGWGSWSGWSTSVTPQAVENYTPVTAITGAAQGQWVKRLFSTNTVDRETVGDYTMMGAAGQGGQKYVAKLVNGVQIALIALAGGNGSTDDHDEPCLIQLPDGRWMAVWNFHGITGEHGFHYNVTSTPHGMDFGPRVNVAGGGTGSAYESTYNQLFRFGDRLIVTYRIGSSSGGQNVLRYSDDFGQTWSAERPLHGLTYMTSAQVGNRLICLSYQHPFNGSYHDVYEFVIDLATGDITAGGASLGNAYSAGALVPRTSMRVAISCPTGTLRMYETDGVAVSYQTMPDIFSAGEYKLGFRNGETGEYVSVSLGTTGLPSLTAGNTGYYGSCVRLDATYAAVSVNVGSSVGVGAWELRIMRTTDGGATYQYVETIRSTPNIIMRVFTFEGRIYWTEFSNYTTYMSWTGTVRSVAYAALVWTKEPSVAAVNPPTATAPGAPTSVAATPGDGSLSVNATPGANNGAAQTKYRVTITSPVGVNPVESTTLPVVLSGLTNGQAYTGTICGYNSAGYGAESAEFTATPVAAGAYIVAEPEVMSLAVHQGGGTYVGLAGSELKNGKVLLSRSLPENEDGELVTQFLPDGLTAGGIALHTSSTPTITYVTCPYGVNWSSATGALAYTTGTGVETSLGVSLSVATWLRLRRQGGTVTLATSTDKVNWTTRYTFAATTTARLTARAFATIATSGTTLERYVRNVSYLGNWVDDVVVP